MKRNNKNEVIDFIDALAKIGEEFQNNLKKYSNNNNTFASLFPELSKEFDNTIKEVDKSINLDTKETPEKCSEVKNDLSHLHMETTETEHEFNFYLRDDDVKSKTEEEIEEILKSKLADFTFAACTDKKDYRLRFSFNGDTVRFEFVWDADLLHFMGWTNDNDFDYGQGPFFFDEVNNRFDNFADSDKKKIEDDCESKPCDEKCDCGEVCDEVCDECPTESCETISEQCEDVCRPGDAVDSVGVPAEDGNVIKSNWTADSLYKEINDEVQNNIETKLLPIIKEGVDRLLTYKNYKLDRTGNTINYDIIVFTLEDVRNLCTEVIGKFWEDIEYSRLVRFFMDTYGFPKVFILDRNQFGGNTHEVRCILK